MTKITSLGCAMARARLEPIRSMRLASHLALVAVVVAMGATGCVNSVASPSALLTPVSSAQTALTPSPPPSPTQTLAPIPTPTAPPTLKSIATGSMHTARAGATATLLQNGKVLVTGGTTAYPESLRETIVASAELYDPATGTFTKTGSMTAARRNHTATLLADGRVLIAGGTGCSVPQQCSDVDSSTLNALSSAEVYNPTTGKFSPTGSMAGRRDNASATLLPDGRVLLAEGNFGPGKSAELYDPNSGKFANTGKEFGFGNAAAALLPNGKVLVSGLSVDPSLYPRYPLIGQIYDEASGNFTKVSFELPPSAMPSAQYNGQTVVPLWPGPMTALKDGRVLIFEGGYLETYDPATGACAAAGFVSPGAQWMTPIATLLTDGRVLFIAGGVKPDSSTGDNQVNTASVAIYDPSSAPQLIGSTKVARDEPTVTLLSNGSVLIAGGADSNGDPLSSTELLKP